MTEIMLPTKAQVDAIKQDTQAILANGGGTDLHEYSFQLIEWNVNGYLPVSSPPKEVVAINGKGIVNFFDLYSGRGYNSVFHVIVDGVTWFKQESYTNGTAREFYGPIPFNDHFIIKEEITTNNYSSTVSRSANVQVII